MQIDSGSEVELEQETNSITSSPPTDEEKSTGIPHLIGHVVPGEEHVAALASLPKRSPLEKAVHDHFRPDILEEHFDCEHILDLIRKIQDYRHTETVLLNVSERQVDIATDKMETNPSCHGARIFHVVEKHLPELLQLSRLREEGCKQLKMHITAMLRRRERSNRRLLHQNARLLKGQKLRSIYLPRPHSQLFHPPKNDESLKLIDTKINPRKPTLSSFRGDAWRELCGLPPLLHSDSDAVYFEVLDETHVGFWDDSDLNMVLSKLAADTKFVSRRWKEAHENGLAIQMIEPSIDGPGADSQLMMLDKGRPQAYIDKSTTLAALDHLIAGEVRCLELLRNLREDAEDHRSRMEDIEIEAQSQNIRRTYMENTE